MIRYVDSSGWTWDVCELDDRPLPPTRSLLSAPPGRADAGPLPPQAPATPRHELADRPAASDGDGTLYFISRRGTRKLSGYPRVWSSLPREQLEALCDRAVTIGAEPY